MICDFRRPPQPMSCLCLRSYYYDKMPYMTDQGQLGRPPGVRQYPVARLGARAINS
jgi:hypothetical protein